jgi:hypothetical protein
MSLGSRRFPDLIRQSRPEANRADPEFGKATGLSQRRLATRAGISDGYLSDVELSRPAVTSDFLVGLLMEVSVESLLFG